MGFCMDNKDCTFVALKDGVCHTYKTCNYGRIVGNWGWKMWQKAKSGAPTTYVYHDPWANWQEAALGGAVGAVMTKEAAVSGSGCAKLEVRNSCKGQRINLNQFTRKSEKQVQMVSYNAESSMVGPAYSATSFDNVFDLVPAHVRISWPQWMLWVRLQRGSCSFWKRQG